MTDISSEDQELIRRYLAGRLGDAEELMVETRIVEDPQFRTEVELTAAIKEGMHALDKKGEISHLIAGGSRRWHRPHLAIAASVAALSVGAGSYLFLQARDELPPTAATETLRFERMRGSDGADVVWERGDLPMQLDLRFDVGLSPAPNYRVTFWQTGRAADPNVDVIVATSTGGEIVLPLEAKSLEPGDYTIRLEPQSATEMAETVTFTLVVTRKRVP